MNRVHQFFPPKLKRHFLVIRFGEILVWLKFLVKLFGYFFFKYHRMYTNIHENFYNVDDLSDAEFDAVKTKFFEIFGHDKNIFEIEVLVTERLEQSVSIHCLFQNNYFVVQLLQ